MSWGEFHFAKTGDIQAYGKICHQSSFSWYLHIASMALGSLDEEGKALYPHHCGELSPPLTYILLSFSTGYPSSLWHPAYFVWSGFTRS